ncbi:hypothetical protein K3495_g11901 [Podosphaera aphanis]|nr:hypothetical protein K3495_g11901 [Podosphaera aphanis]
MRFGRLKGAREAIGRESEGTPKRIFAEDIPDEWAAHKGSKEYLVSTLRDIHRHCFYRERPNVYEIINHEAHNYLYFDMDREKRVLLPPASPGLVPDEFYSVNASDITRDDVYQSIKFIQSVLSAYIGLALGLSSPELKIMSGSSKHKLSLHIVVPDVLMDSCQTLTAAFAWEFAAFMEKQVRVMLSSGDTPADTRRALLRIVNVCPTAPIGGSFVDHSVYTRSQCFRLLGCCKPGKAPLTLVTLGAPIDDLYFYEERHWDFGTVAGTVRSFASTLVTPANLDALQEAYTVRLGSTFPFRSAFRVEVERNWRRQDDMAAEARVEGVPEEEDWLERSRGLGGEGLGTGTGIGDNPLAGARTLFDTALIFNQYSNPCEFRDFVPGDECFDPFCEVINGVPRGRPSARMVRDRNSTRETPKGFWCFNCNRLVISVTTWNPTPLYHRSEDVVTPCSRFINAGLNRDIVLRLPGPRMQVVDAPTGSGKTELLARYCRQYPEASILLISFRRALACNLAVRLGLSDYKTPGIWLDRQAMRRVAMCVDSTAKITPDKSYDVVLVDEAGAIRRHMVSDVMDKRGPWVRRSVRRLLQRAKTTIITQYQLMESDVEFWCSFAGLDRFDKDVCQRWIVPSEPWCPPMIYSTDFEETIWHLRRCYTEAYDVTDDRTECPIVVFCSLASHATMLLSYWIECVAPTERAKTRARGIWGSIQKHAFAQDFLSNPNRFARECDILFVTPILQAGHSLDKWFRLSFSLLTNGNLTHRDEFQFTARLRQREDLIPYRYAYIESGLGDGLLADERQITTDLDHTARVYGDPDEGEDIVISTLAEAHAELADTKNRHTQLWLERFRANPSDIVTFLRLYDDDDMVKAPIQECLELKAQLELHQEQAENYVSSQAVLLVAPRTSRPTEATAAARREPSRSPVPTRVSTPGPTWDETPGPTREATPGPTWEATPAPTWEATPAPTLEATPAPTLEGTPVPTSDLGVGGSHVLSDELDFEAQSLRNNRKAPFYIRDVVLLGVYHDLLLAKAGVPSLWNARCAKAKGVPKKSAANQFAEMLFDLQELMYQRQMRLAGVVNPPRFLGWFEGEWPAESVKDVSDPDFFDICNRRAEAWIGLANGRTFAKVVREGQRSPRQHLAAVFKKFGLQPTTSRKQTRQGSGSRESESVQKFRSTDVKAGMKSLYPMRVWPDWQEFEEYLTDPMFSYLAEARSPYDAAEDDHRRTNPESWASTSSNEWFFPGFP